MKKNLFSAMAVAALAMLATSCSSEFDNVTANNSKENLVHKTFTATQETGVTSRTALGDNGYTINWELGDQVMVYDGIDYHPFSALQYGGTTTPLEGSVHSGSSAFSAYYMGSSYSDAQSSLTITLPKEQTATNGSFDRKANLMYAPQKDDFTLNFKNVCSYLKLTTTKEYTKIVLTTDVAIAGQGEINASGDTYVFNPTTNTSKSVTLVPASGSTTIAAGTCYIAIAPVTATTITTDCYNTDGTTYDELALSGSYTLARGQVNNLGSTGDEGWETKTVTTGTAKAKLTAGSSTETDVQWVQLWENGSKWAVFNVGATSVTEYGGYYYWGSISRTSYSSSSDDIQGTDDDTAKNLWGNNWQMPKSEDFTKLLSTDYTDGGVWKSASESGYSVAGMLFTGKSGTSYANNSVFFPAAGLYGNDNGYGYYWSSTPYSSSGYAYRLNFGSSSRKVGSFSCNSGYSVRAVLNE